MTSKKTNPETDATHQIEEIFESGKKSVEQVMKTSTEGYEQALKMTKEHVGKASEAFFKGYTDVSSMNKESIDAFVNAGEVLTKGTNTVGQACFEFACASAEASVEATKAMMSIKVPKDFLDIQSKYGQINLDKVLAESTRLSEMSAKVANEAFDPLKKKLNESFEKTFKVPSF
jgi:phasin family protein